MAHFFRPVVDASYSDITKDGAAGVSWSRSADAVTVTATLGSLAAGDIVAISNSSDTGALPNGDYVVGSIGSGTFVITGVDTGAASGTADWTAYVWYDAASSGGKQASKPSGSDAVTIVRQKCTLSANEAAASVTVNAGVALDMSTFNLALTGAMTVNGTHTMGSSSGTGLTCYGLAFGASSTRDWAIMSKVNNYGDHTLASGMTITSGRGFYTQKANGTVTGLTSSSFRALVIDAGVTLAVGNNNTYLTSTPSSATVINGTLSVPTNMHGLVGVTGAMSGSVTSFSDAGGGNTQATCSSAHQLTEHNVLTIAGTSNYNGTYAITVVDTFRFTIVKAFAGTETGTWASAGAFLVGAGGDISGAGQFSMLVFYTSNISNSRASAFSMTGFARVPGTVTNGLALPAWDFSNASVILGGLSSGSGQRYITAGTLKCKDFAYSHNGTATELIMSESNPSLWVGGAFSLAPAAGTLTYTKGTGTITLDGTAAGTSNIDLNGQSVEDIVVNNSVGATGIKALTASGTTDSLTITSGTLDLSTHSLTVTGATNVTGTLKIGVSAGTGLTTNGLTFNSGAKGDFQTASKINNSDGFSAPNEAWMINNGRGAYVQTASGTFANPNSSGLFFGFTVNALVTATASGTTRFSSFVSGSTVINGTLACGANSCTIGSASTGSITVGVNGDITGSGTFSIGAVNGATLTNNKSGAFSHSGTFAITAAGTDNFVMPAWDFSNAQVTILGSPTSGRTRMVGPGTLKCKTLWFSDSGGFAYTISGVHNPSFEVTGDVIIYNPSVCTYNKGAGSIWLRKATGYQYVDFQGKSVENVVCGSEGAEKQFASDFSTGTITFLGGSVNSGLSGTRRVVTVTNTSVAANTTFKDLSMGSKNKINAKSAGNVNLGNCLGIVFRDRARVN